MKEKLSKVIDELKEVVINAMKKTNIPGLAIALVNDG